MKRILMACSQYWSSPLRVGSHQIARILAKDGWQVAYVSFPISPAHLFGPRGQTRLKDRFAVYRAGGIHAEGGKLWSYVPGSVAVPANKPLLKSGWLHKNWHRLTVPSIQGRIRQQGFDSVDVLYFDSVYFNFLLDGIEARQVVYRAADDPKLRDTYCPAVGREQEALVKAADVVLYPSRGVKNGIDSGDPEKFRYFSNGVVFDDYAAKAELPPEYSQIPRPRAVFAGAIVEWLDFQALNQAAEALPGVSFVYIGPLLPPAKKIARLNNVFLLGEKGYHQLPGYLQHADVGLMPFDAKGYPELVGGFNPAKLYQYFACGKPVVASDWREIREMDLPVFLSRDTGSFVGNIKAAIANPGDSEKYIRIARANDWGLKVRELFQGLGQVLQV